MKSKLSKTYYGRTVLNVIFSSIVFFIVVFFALYNTIIINQSDEVNIFNQSFINNMRSGIFLNIVLSVILALVAFTITFIFLERRRNKYIEYIYDSIKRISRGDLSKEVKVLSEDELSLMAKNLNLMQVKIKDLIDNERISENSKNELITNIAHDLRTPLTSILGYLELLEKNNNLSEEQKEKYTSIAFEKSKKLESLVEDLFSYTKMSYGKKLAINLEKIDIVRLLNQLVDELYPLFEKENIVCDIESKIDKYDIMADSKLIVRLFENLINNAIKYGKDGKRININIDVVDENIVKIEVVNYGKLIPKSSLDKLFDKFYRVDSDRSSQTGGTGLGLAIAKSIVDLHAGEIYVESDFSGTKFIVELKKNLNITENEAF